MQVIGFHTSIQKRSIADSMLDAPVVQIYLGGNATYNRRSLTDSDKKAIKKNIKDGHKLFVHSSLSINLAKEDSARSIDALKTELNSTHDINCSCILHVGKVGTLNNVGDNINDLYSDSNIRDNKHLVLETAAGQGTELGAKWSEMRKLSEMIDLKPLNICLDTQHLFASGMSSLSDHESVVRLIDKVNSIGTLSVVHLNDSKKEFKSRVDRHESIGKGYIWYDNKESLISLMNICKDNNIPCILETPDVSSDYEYLLELMSNNH